MQGSIFDGHEREIYLSRPSTLVKSFESSPVPRALPHHKNHHHQCPVLHLWKLHHLTRVWSNLATEQKICLAHLMIATLLNCVTSSTVCLLLVGSATSDASATNFPPRLLWLGKNNNCWSHSACKCSLQIISSIKAVLDWSGVEWQCFLDVKQTTQGQASQGGSWPSNWGGTQSSAATYPTVIPYTGITIISVGYK